MTVTNPSGHSSLPRPDNAIYELATALKKVEAYRFPYQANAITRSSLGVLGKLTPGPIGDAMRAFAADPANTAAADRIASDPAHVGQVRTTCVATMLQAGHAPNALPAPAVANVNCRIFPETPWQDVQATLQRVVGTGAKVTLDTTYEPRVGPPSPPNTELYVAVAKAVHLHYPGVEIAYSQQAGGSDGSVFRMVGIPSYGTSGLFQRDEDEFAHGLNERVRVDAFYNSVDYMWTLITTLAPLG